MTSHTAQAHLPRVILCTVGWPSCISWQLICSNCLLFMLLSDSGCCSKFNICVSLVSCCHGNQISLVSANFDEYWSDVLWSVSLGVCLMLVSMGRLRLWALRSRQQAWVCPHGSMLRSTVAAPLGCLAEVKPLHHCELSLCVSLFHAVLVRVRSLCHYTHTTPQQ